MEVEVFFLNEEIDSVEKSIFKANNTMIVLMNN